ncbi:cytochrome c biogenesis protein CcdA [Pelagibius litoralis]|uniref:Cytochrome c biogenesis protein CcdA n=1 Tax=Pelagibius litoralis TaxID=374515 RepID=A0A967KA95_9PROT|nr:cytochrome c biogenesis protein CcdA [Pelagibius litoralis]NIA69734.1 cytochrome c biogenesis protein CcdA [Pelagibius litoralis]
MGFDVSFGGAFVAGLLSFLSPCVLPLVPPYLCFVAGMTMEEMAEETRPDAGRRVAFAALFFVLGFMTVFVALGASASFAGQLVAEHLALLSYLAGAVIIVMGLHFLGVIRIPLLYREARFHPASRPAGLAGAYVIGLAFAFGWTPCVGPILAAILFMAGSEETVARGAGLLALYGLGIGIPFLLAALFAGSFMRFAARFRRHVATVEKVMGGLLVVTGVLFITGSMSTLSYWLLDAFPALGTIG